MQRKVFMNFAYLCIHNLNINIMNKILEVSKVLDNEFGPINIDVYQIAGPYLIEVSANYISLLELKTMPKQLSDSKAIDIRKNLDIHPCCEIGIKELYLAEIYEIINTTKI